MPPAPLEASRLLEAWGLGEPKEQVLGGFYLRKLLGDPWRLFGCSLGIPWELWGDSWELSRTLEASGCSLDAPWELCCVPWGRLGASWELLGFLGALLGWTLSGLSRLASISSALLGVLGGDMS